MATLLARKKLVLLHPEWAELLNGRVGVACLALATSIASWVNAGTLLILLRRRLEQGTPQHHAAEIIVTEAERMAEIVRKIGKITRYETKAYVGSTQILDLDKSTTDG